MDRPLNLVLSKSQRQIQLERIVGILSTLRLCPVIPLLIEVASGALCGCLAPGVVRAGVGLAGAVGSRGGCRGEERGFRSANFVGCCIHLFVRR